MCRRRAAARLRADWPSGNAPTTRVPSDLAQDAVKWVVGPNAPPVLLGEVVVGQCLLKACCRKLGGPGQPQCVQFLDHLQSFLARRRKIFARVDCLQHRRNLADLGRGHLTEDVALPMDNASLPHAASGKNSPALSLSPKHCLRNLMSSDRSRVRCLS
jgi:hypothetical protein